MSVERKAFRGVVIRRWSNRTRMMHERNVDLLVEVDWYAIAQVLGEKAVGNKSKRSSEIGGCVKVTITAESEVKS